MPFSFTQIEKDKSFVIQGVMLFLFLFYFVTIWLIGSLVKNFFVLENHSPYHQVGYGMDPVLWLNGRETGIVFMAAIGIGVIHFLLTIDQLIPKMLKTIGAGPLEEADTYHQQFKNIIDEVSVATGGIKIHGAVVNTMALNAFALSDFNGNHVIGITEGMLARLNRSQLEAVVGHEAAHIVTGDCLSTTVTSAMFELYGGMLKAVELLIRGSGHRRGYSRSSSSGGFIAFLVLVYALLMLTRAISMLLRLFISRQREYRADAIAVRLTRNPLALAESLASIAYHWRGDGLSVQELEAIFIMNPKVSRLDESLNMWSDLFSTHPPLEKRIHILMDMAHTDIQTLMDTVQKEKSRVPAPEGPVVAAPQQGWMLHKDGAWQGPFDIERIMALQWLRPETWVERVGTNKVSMVYEDDQLAGALHGKEHAGGALCPRCHVPLHDLVYEGIIVKRCGFCQGTLVEEHHVQKIILRREFGFSERVKRIATNIQKEATHLSHNRIRIDRSKLYVCPVCRHPQDRMNKIFYTLAYPVEVDRCHQCRHIWFDQDELEVLQCLIEGENARII